MKQEILTVHFENSSNLLRADYDKLMKTLKVYFKSGGVYTYLDVNQSVFDEFKKAESAGRYFVQNVKYKYDFFKNI